MKPVEPKFYVQTTQLMSIVMIEAKYDIEDGPFPAIGSEMVVV